LFPRHALLGVLLLLFVLLLLAGDECGERRTLSTLGLIITSQVTVDALEKEPSAEKRSG
jgi:hypothetical protein